MFSLQISRSIAFKTFQFLLAIGLLLLVAPSSFAAETASFTSPQTISTTTTLQAGSRGSAVEVLQAQLQQLGYFRGPTDGIYGQATAESVMQFQRDRALLADGIAGAQTLQQLQSNLLLTSSNPVSGMSPDIQRILDRGKLIVAVLGKDNPPFFKQNGAGDRLEGLDVKIARSIAENLGVSVEFDRSATTFDEVVERVFQQQADLAISKISRTLNRAKRVQFSRPYVTMRHGLLINRLQIAQQARGRSMAEVVRDLEGKVGVIRGSSYVGFTKQAFPKATVVEFPAWVDVIAAVVQGDILAAYRDELEVKKLVLTKPGAALQFQTIALTDTQDAIAIVASWSSNQLLAFVNQYLDTDKLEYTADTLIENYPESFQPES